MQIIFVVSKRKSDPSVSRKRINYNIYYLKCSVVGSGLSYVKEKEGFFITSQNVAICLKTFSNSIDSHCKEKGSETFFLQSCMRLDLPSTVFLLRGDAFGLLILYEDGSPSSWK